MTDIHPNFQAETAPIMPVALRFSVIGKIITSLAVFATFLFLFLNFSWNVLIPHVTHTSLLGMEMPIDDVLARKQLLTTKLASLESKRSDRMFGSDPLHIFVSQQKLQEESGLDLVVRMMALAAAQDVPGSVIITGTTLDRDESTLTLKGDVHGVGPRSMTVLATFVDAINAVSSVSQVQTSPFTRQVLPDGSPHSPFTLVVHFHAS